MKAMSVLAVGLLLAGCKLIDQTTFAPSPEAPTTEAVAPPKVDTRTPLVTIDYGGPPPDYLGLLRFAVHAAETRAPGVEYDVIGMLPSGGDAAAEQRRAVEVMRAIMGQGVSASRIHLGLRTEPAGGAQEIRVYVR
jgi:hypothetical protein